MLGNSMRIVITSASESLQDLFRCFLPVSYTHLQNRVSMAQGLLPAEVTKVGVTTQKRQNSMLMVFSLYDETDSYNISLLKTMLILT